MREVRNLAVSGIIMLSFCCAISGQREIKLTGTVIAEEILFGHIYDGNAVKPRLLLIRVDEVKKKAVSSKYILVNYRWRLYDRESPIYNLYATQWNLTLFEEESCNSTLERLQFSFISYDTKITGMVPRLQRKKGIIFEPISFSEVLPCYKLERGNFQQVKTFAVDEKLVSTSDVELFVLESERWTNALGTPIWIGVDGNGLFFYKNIAKKKIVAYRLGCISKNALERAIVVSEMKEITEDIDSDESLLTPRGSGGTFDKAEEVKVCYDNKAKLSVVEALFEDKSVWRADK